MDVFILRYDQENFNEIHLPCGTKWNIQCKVAPLVIDFEIAQEKTF